MQHLNVQKYLESYTPVLVSYIFSGSLVKGRPTPPPRLSNTPGGSPPPVPMVRIGNQTDPKRLPRESGYEVDRPAGVEAIPGYSVGQGRG